MHTSLIPSRRSSPLLLAIAVLGLQLWGAVSLWRHASNDPVILGRYALDFFAFIVVYHLGIVLWVSLVLGLAKDDAPGLISGLDSLIARSRWFWIGVFGLWIGVLGFLILSYYLFNSLPTLVRLAIVISAIYLTAYSLNRRGISPQRYLNPSALLVTGLLVVYLVVLNLLDPYSIIVILREDGPVEWTTAVFFLLSSLVAFYAARDFRRNGRPAWYLLSMGLLCLFVALEEISWGQRILGFSTPEAISAVNIQNETNLHNSVGRLFSLNLRYMSAGVFSLFGIVIPLLSNSGRVKSLVNRFNLLLPSLWQLPLFLLAVVLWLLPLLLGVFGMEHFDFTIDRTEELAECITGLGILLTLVTGFLHWLSAGATPRETPVV